MDLNNLQELERIVIREEDIPEEFREFFEQQKEKCDERAREAVDKWKGNNKSLELYSTSYFIFHHPEPCSKPVYDMKRNYVVTIDGQSYDLTLGVGFVICNCISEEKYLRVKRTKGDI